MHHLTLNDMTKDQIDMFIDELASWRQTSKIDIDVSNRDMLAIMSNEFSRLGELVDQGLQCNQNVLDQ